MFVVLLFSSGGPGTSEPEEVGNGEIYTVCTWGCFLVNGAKGLETQVGCDLELCTLVLFEDKPNKNSQFPVHSPCNPNHILTLNLDLDF